MKSKMNRLFSFFISLLMVISIMPKTVFAANINESFIVDGMTYRVTSEKEVALANIGATMKKEIIIPETVQDPNSDFTYTVSSIDEFVFVESEITSVSIPSAVQMIGEFAFAGCLYLENVSFYGNPQGTLEMGEYVFDTCISLQKIDLPDNLETISGFTFFDCASLQSVDFPKNLKKIGSSAFFGCKSLKKVELPEGLEEIGVMAFSFESGGKLEYMNIPASVTTLGEYFLTGVKADGQTALVFEGKTPPTNMDGALKGISYGYNMPTLYFPADAADVYASSGSPFVNAGLIDLDPSEGEQDLGYSLELPESFGICPGRIDQLPYTSSIPTGVVLSWTSDNPNVVKVDQAGKLEGVSNGTTTITATILIQGVKQYSDSCKVTVGHSYAWAIDKEPTKDQSGLKYQYCVDCYHKTNYVSIPAIGYTEKVEHAVYRAYNPNNGEHLYTTNYDEFMHITKNGWHDEGVAFMTELNAQEGNPLFRVYNPNSGLHHYTLDETEKNILVSLGWQDEKVAWYTSKKPQSAPVYRVYNPNDGNHHYTMNKQEKDVLISLGWHDEGLAFRTAPLEA